MAKTCQVNNYMRASAVRDSPALAVYARLAVQGDGPRIRKPAAVVRLHASAALAIADSVVHLFRGLMVLLLVALASGMDGGGGSRRLPGVAVVVAEGTRRGGDVHRYVAHELSHGGLCGVRLPSSTGPAVAPRVPTTRLAARDTAPRSPSPVSDVAATGDRGPARAAAGRLERREMGLPRETVARRPLAPDTPTAPRGTAASPNRPTKVFGPGVTNWTGTAATRRHRLQADRRQEKAPKKHPRQAPPFRSLFPAHTRRLIR